MDKGERPYIRLSLRQVQVSGDSPLRSSVFALFDFLSHDHFFFRIFKESKKKQRVGRASWNTGKEKKKLPFFVIKPVVRVFMIVCRRRLCCVRLSRFFVCYWKL